jgi:hypothetical protein
MTLRNARAPKTAETVTTDMLSTEPYRDVLDVGEWRPIAEHQ